jgi:hypothetical protein
MVWSATSSGGSAVKENKLKLLDKRGTPLY